MLLAVLQFTSVDNDFKYETDYEKCRKTLQQMLPQAQSGKEKAEVFWRLSRVCLVLGENEENVSIKRSLYKEGMEYAAKGMSVEEILKETRWSMNHQEFIGVDGRLDYLIYNDPLAYADLILNGDTEDYLRNVTQYELRED